MRILAITFAAGGLSILWVTITGLLPGSLQWFPFGTYPAVGSPQWLAIYSVSVIIFGVMDWIRFRGHTRRNLVEQGVLQR
jgi:hypothetical protein